MADEDVFPLTIGGREMLFKKSSEGSLVALRRAHSRLLALFNAETDPTRRSELASKMGAMVLDAAETRFVDPADVSWVEDQLIADRIQISDVMPIFANGAAREESAPDDAPPSKKTVAKRSPKAAPAKKTANASRARR